LLLHDSHNFFYRSPLGALPCGASLRLRFTCDFARSVQVRTWDGQESFHTMALENPNTYAAEITAPATPMLWWYDFVIHTDTGVLRYGNAYDQLGGEGALYDSTPASFQVTVYDPAFETPFYLHHGIIYQIFPDRFSRCISSPAPKRKDICLHENWDETPLLRIDPRSNDNMALDFFGGNLNGITQKLSYLKDLGVTVLYLNPIFQARSNHKYDTGDYRSIDPMFGSEEDFLVLCEKASAMNIRVILDGVFSHTGEDSVYFNKYGTYESVGAYQSPDSPYSSWFTFTKYPDGYKCWWNIPTLPEVRKDDPPYRTFLFSQEDGIVPLWLKEGASGWRLDVADELSMDFLRELRKAAKQAKSDAAILGEVWEDASNKISYNVPRSYCLGDTLDSVMNYPLREGIISFLTCQTNAPQLARLIRHQQEVYPVPFLYALMNLLGSHDRARIINVLAGCEWGYLPREERANLLLTPEQYRLGSERFLTGMEILCALPGAPTLYYGDEAGLQGTADPFSRGTFPWGREDIKLQSAVQALLQRRKNNPVLQTGFLEATAMDEDTLLIRRWVEGGKDALGEHAENGEEIIKVRR
jgi:cyclomaltodextrinase / maltogenic alpha-amylase / neopullulanase